MVKYGIYYHFLNSGHSILFLFIDFDLQKKKKNELTMLCN